MSLANPEKAIAALLPPSIPIEGTEEVVRPLTLGAFAVLERIRSPMLQDPATATDPATVAPGVLDIIPSLFVLCRGPVAALESKSLLLDAVAWADAIPPSALVRIKDAAKRQIAIFVDAAPTPKKEEAGTPATTAG